MVNDMLVNAMNYKKSLMEKYSSDGKIDPGMFSFMEPGWWALHVTAIAGIYLLGCKARNH